jgi:hypothetical protein
MPRALVPLLLVLLFVFSPPADAQGRKKKKKKKRKAVWTVPILVIKYFPLTPDKKRIDIKVTSNVDAPLDRIRAKVDRMTKETREALQEGSRFRAYKNPKAPPSLRYVVVDAKEFLEALPVSKKKTGEAFLPDYRSILERVGIQRYVEKLGVKEVWIWGYHSKEVAPWESNMASQFGDVSNSDRDTKDLPVLKQTYTVYHYNYQRETSEAVHNHIHQIEAVMRKHGGDLWQTWEGKPGSWRCGNCHFPPNGKKDYDWANKDFVESDIEDWRPEGFGKMKRINCDRWGGDSLKWFVYWMQSMPGYRNRLVYKRKRLTNWWVFMADYDLVRTKGIELTEKR